MNKDFKKEVYRVFLGLALATASTSLVNPLNAKAVPIEQTIEDANKDEQLKRMKKDYEKIKEAYLNRKNILFDCNSNKDMILLGYEVQHFIETYACKYNVDLTPYTTVDEVIKALDSNNADYNFEAEFAEYYLLKNAQYQNDEERYKAFEHFMKTYAPHYGELVAHNYYVLLVLQQGIRLELASDVETIIEGNHDFLDHSKFIDAKYEPDNHIYKLSVNYEGIKVIVDLTAGNDVDGYANEPNDEDKKMTIDGEEKYVGDGIAEIGEVHDKLGENSTMFIGLMNGKTKEEDLKAFYDGVIPVKPAGKVFVNPNNNEEQQVYEVTSSKKVYELALEGVKVLFKINPSTGFDMEKAEEVYGEENLNIITQMGYGRWEKENTIEVITDENGKITEVHIYMTYQKPNISFREEIKKHPEIMHSTVVENKRVYYEAPDVMRKKMGQ